MAITPLPQGNEGKLKDGRKRPAGKRALSRAPFTPVIAFLHPKISVHSRKLKETLGEKDKPQIILVTIWIQFYFLRIFSFKLIGNTQLTFQTLPPPQSFLETSQSKIKSISFSYSFWGQKPKAKETRLDPTKWCDWHLLISISEFLKRCNFSDVLCEIFHTKALNWKAKAKSQQSIKKQWWKQKGGVRARGHLGHPLPC